MIGAVVATLLALQLGEVHQVQYRVPVHPPPCGHGWDVSARDGMCYPNGYLPPQEQAARQYYGGGRSYGHYPVPCGNGADIDTRDGQCTRPERFRRSFNRAGKAITAMTITSAVRGVVTIERPLRANRRALGRFLGSGDSAGAHCHQHSVVPSRVKSRAHVSPPSERGQSLRSPA